jgi:uncharacterized protein (DUF427 family)
MLVSLAVPSCGAQEVDFCSASVHLNQSCDRMLVETNYLQRKPNSSEATMYTATWNGAVIAQSDKTIEIEGNQYFPMDSVESEFLVDSDTTSTCSWKGVANYYSLNVDGELNTDAVWVYREPKDAAKEIANHVAFWRGVTVSAA